MHMIHNALVLRLEVCKEEEEDCHDVAVARLVLPHSVPRTNQNHMILPMLFLKEGMVVLSSANINNSMCSNA